MTLQKCTETKDVFNMLVKIEQNLTIQKSIEESPLIRYQGKKLDVLPHIIRIIDFFIAATGKEMERFQIQILAGDLYEKFKYDTLDDIILLFKMARLSEFGKVYKFDSTVVMDWANKYLEIKAIKREELLRKKKYSANEDDTNKSNKKVYHISNLPPELQNKLDKIGKKKEEIQRFLNVRITDIMTEEKHRRQIAKNIENDKK